MYGSDGTSAEFYGSERTPLWLKWCAWGGLLLAAGIAACCLGGCGDSMKSTFAPNATTADELVKQTKAQQDIAASMRRIADALERVAPAKGAR